jgi:hypothetical protein
MLRMGALRRRLHNIDALFLTRIYSRSIVHVIGDSHVLAFVKNRFFIIHHIGPATAYNLCLQTSTTHSNEKLLKIVKKINKKRDFAVLVFGEIDSRVHIYYQYKKQKEVVPISQIINETVSKYGEMLKLLDKSGLSFFVYGIPPASKRENNYNYPFYANKEMRVKISRELNESLKKFCVQNGYQYLDVQSKFADVSGFITEEFAGDDVHLNQKAAMIIAEDIRIKIGPRVRAKKGYSIQEKTNERKHESVMKVWSF